MRSRFLPVLVFAIAAVVLQACGGGVEGTYVSEQKTPTGESAKMTLQLKSGGVAVMTLSAGAAKISEVTGTYTVEGDKVTTVLGGEKDSLTLKDGALTTTAFGETIVLKKQ